MYRIRCLQLTILFFISPICLAQHPIITTQYTADPSARVFKDTMYLYPSHDKEDAKWFNMSDWHVFSSVDMKNWTDYGIALSLDSLQWAKKLAWAPDCAYRNNKYYFYYPVEKNYIGVAVGDRPSGPFTDPLQKPLIKRTTPGVIAKRGLIDPTLFMDDDSIPYLIFGQNTVNIVKLNSDMISFKDSVKSIKGAKKFFEGAWMHKYNGKYYLSYSGKSKLAARGKIHYAISDNPYGPFTHKGVIIGKVNSGTNHASIVEFKSKWYIFYHTADLFLKKHPEVSKYSTKKYFRRSVCFQELNYNNDGTIQKVHLHKK